MIKYFLIGLLVFAGSLDAKQIRCLCNDATAVLPECGICGVELGTMEETAFGVACICENKLKAREIACPDVCKDHGGWSGAFK